MLLLTAWLVSIIWLLLAIYFGHRVLTLAWIVIFMGVNMNALVVLNNGGCMPVDVPQDLVIKFSPGRHCLMTTETHLNALADWINVGEWIGVGTVFIVSPGDMFITVGYIFLVIALVLFQSKRSRSV